MPSYLDQLKSWRNRFLVWRARRISQKQFIIILSVLVGFVSGLAAVVIKSVVRFIESWQKAAYVRDVYEYLYFVFPLIGIIITVTLIRYILRHKVYPGIPSVLFAISKRKSLMKRHNMWSSILGSAFTIGFGGSAGLEGPTVATTAALGSNLAASMRQSYKVKTLLIGCAAAGSMAAIFQAPVAAIVFAVEVIMLDLTMASMVPLLLASVTATLTATLFLPEDTLLTVDISYNIKLPHVLWFIGLGVIAGFFSLGFTYLFNMTNKVIGRIKQLYKKAILGGLVLGGLLFLFPALYGEGYSSINALMYGKPSRVIDNPFVDQFDPTNLWVLACLLLLLLIFKAISTALTTSIGGVGGIFAPTLFMGAAMGYLYARIVRGLGYTEIPETHYTLLGMAGLMAGVLHAPLTAIFLIAEITGGYDLFVPLMITAAIAYTTVKLFSKHSVYTEQLAMQGSLITHDKDSAVLTLMTLQSEIEKDLVTVTQNMTLGDLVPVIANSKRNMFPVVNEEQELIGMLHLDQVREIMFDQELYDEVSVSELMDVPEVTIETNETMDVVMDKFEQTRAWSLPVVEDKIYIGVVSRSRLFTAYRKRLQEVSSA